MIDPQQLQVLIGTGAFLGGSIAGIFGAKKMGFMRIPANGDSTSNGNGKIEKSSKTSGALHVSEEGLAHIKEIRLLLEEKYLPAKEHAILCEKQMANIQLYIQKEITQSTDKIIKAIGNGKTRDE